MAVASYWTYLGLEEPTRDLKVIRRAYAKKLRETRPDEDPDGFMKLRQAFEDAKWYANTELDFADKDVSEADIIDTPGLDPDIEITHAPTVIPLSDTALDERPEFDTIKPAETDVETLLKKVEDILQQSGTFNQINVWQRVLDRAHGLGLDDYQLFEHEFLRLLSHFFGYFNDEAPPKKGLQRYIPLRPAKPKMQRRIGEYIFEHMGWNRWKSTPAYMQSQLLHILYELEIKDRPKEEESGKQLIFGEFKALVRGFIIAVVFGFLAELFEKDIPETNTPLLPTSGEAIYGTYSVDREAGKWNYQLDTGNEAVLALAPEETLTDVIEVQFDKNSIDTVTITITGGETQPDLTHDTESKDVRPDTTTLLSAICFLIAGVAGIYTLFRFGGFLVGVMIGLIGMGLGGIWSHIRRLLTWR